MPSMHPLPVNRQIHHSRTMEAAVLRAECELFLQGAESLKMLVNFGQVLDLVWIGIFTKMPSQKRGVEMKNHPMFFVGAGVFSFFTSWGRC